MKSDFPSYETSADKCILAEDMGLIPRGVLDEVLTSIVLTLWL